ncbi:DNA-binding protein [Actinocorallia libanotica]|uniref:DNA-binding protein n=1 Tax=Actinocorallia libanotica TaxID=46162 RepID=A0ABN1Q3Y4_9ACTN
MNHVEELLDAGAVLPPGTGGGGDRAVPLAARTYRHPALEGRTVVRLVDAGLSAAEDLAAGFLGLEPEGEPEVVGVGLRATLGFPEWVLAHHPEDGHHALAVVPEMDRITRRAKTKPKAALDAFHALADRLAAAVPHLLPTYYERAGREFLAVENAVYAAQMFSRARRSEAEYGLEIDEDRLDAVFLEFALAGALPVKTLSGYAKELAARVPADEALRRFTRLCVRRTAGGMPPSAQMATDLRRLARAAGSDADAVEHAYLEEVLALPSTVRAAAGWWKAHRASLAALARRRPEVRGMLLGMMPSADADEMAGLWLEIMEESGALAFLCGPAGEPGGEDAQDSAADWLKRFLKTFFSGSYRTPPPALLALTERMADRLKAELAGAEAFPAPQHADLLDLMLTLGIPVEPPQGHSLFLEAWAAGEDRRDLTAIEADPRFRPSFLHGADRLGGGDPDRRAMVLLAASPGGRPMMAEWVDGVARRSTAAGLPDLPDALRRLSMLPVEVLALAEDAVRRAVGTGVGQALTRTLRAGLLDELGWPAWDEAVAALTDSAQARSVHVADAWPHLVVGGRAHARVIGAEGTVLAHDLRIPAGDGDDVGFHYVDGELLVQWNSRQHNGRLTGYWHTAPDRQLSLEGHGPRRTSMYWYQKDQVSLPLPGGGRTTGAGPLHAGDTVLPGDREIVSDGTRYWVWSSREGDEGQGWYEYDPASGEQGDRSAPDFFADALRGLPEESSFASGWMFPLPGAGATPAGTPVDGLLGWRVVRLPDGTVRGEDLAGNTVTAPRGGQLLGPLFLPGDDRPRGVLHGSYQTRLVDPDGVVTSFACSDKAPGPFTEGTALLPPMRYWHCMVPRDPEGSAALRRLGQETAESLLKAAEVIGTAEANKAAEADEAAERMAAAVRELLPDLTEDRLVAGVAGVVRYAAAQQGTLNAAAERLERVLTGEPEQNNLVEGPGDESIGKPLQVMVDAGERRSYSRGPELFTQLQAVERAMAAGAADGERPGIHLDGTGIPFSGLSLTGLLENIGAVAYLAASPFTGEEGREAVLAFLRRCDELGLTAEDHALRWRRVKVRLAEPLLTGPDGGWREGHWYGILPLPEGAFLTAVDFTRSQDHAEFTALLHDPAGRFEVPAPYEVLSSKPVTDARYAGRAGAYLAACAERGAAPWFPGAAAEFAELTGVTETVAKLVIGGMLGVGTWERNFLSAETRAALGVKVADAAFARTEAGRPASAVRRAVLAALLPEDPARLWTDGPDVAEAVRVWNREVGVRVAVPEAIAAEAAKAVRGDWESADALPALLDPASEPRLTRDLKWTVQGDKVRPEEGSADGFTAATLTGSVAMAAWLAHRLPAGDPLRARLPAALTAVRERLANPDLMLGFNRYVNLPSFRKVAGNPTETGPGFERYGAVVMATHDDLPYPAIKTALLDETGGDPYLPVLRGEYDGLLAVELSLGLVRDERFAALLADPGDPAAGERDADGTWWPQDPSRSVPGLVAEAASRYDLGPDAAVVYLMLLAMPDPTDKNTARWTGWKPARLKAARAELAATDLVVEARRPRASRSLFLPCGWNALRAPHPPQEEWKLPLYDLLEGAGPKAPLGVLVPAEPVADLYRRAWRRITEGDVPRFGNLKSRR